MKKSIIAGLLLIAASCKLTGQTAVESTTGMSKKFVAAMEANLKLLDTANAPATFIMLANNFERIGNAEKNQWQPFYYAAFCYAIMVANVPDKSKIDFFAEKAASYLVSADDLEKNNSEISSLHGMILYTRVLVDPISRWQTMGKEAMDYLVKAKQQDPSNPRPYLIEARAKLHTPEGLGGGAKAAKLAIEECLARFKTFVSANSLAPSWGQAQAERLSKSIVAQ
ncbi:hypothetical protein [Terrimonas alba]|uniref:hypothetical protein n=1 Tax=Terrimonas alba TaxID=3349636 RepID=UPI0035F35E0B